jgi:hypothetical protein
MTRPIILGWNGQYSVRFFWASGRWATPPIINALRARSVRWIPLDFARFWGSSFFKNPAGFPTERTYEIQRIWGPNPADLNSVSGCLFLAGFGWIAVFTHSYININKHFDIFLHIIHYKRCQTQDEIAKNTKLVIGFMVGETRSGNFTDSGLKTQASENME